MPGHDRLDQIGHRVGVTDVAAVELVRQAFHLMPGAGDDGRALFGEHRADTGPDASTPPVTSMMRPPRSRSIVLAYQASACLGSDTGHRSAMTITSSTVEPGIVAVTVDYPPVNAIPSRGCLNSPTSSPPPAARC